MKLSAGTSIARYRVDDYIGAGGMQEVYKATDTLLRRTVALKRPKNDDGARRFDRSAHVSAKVNHSNVTRTLDYFEHGDQRYLVEEFVDGLDLGAFLKRVPRIDPYITAQIVHSLARAMAAMHEVDAVHRDLKPSNIMAVGGFKLSDVKVTDFGVAKFGRSRDRRGIGRRTSHDHRVEDPHRPSPLPGAGDPQKTVHGASARRYLGRGSARLSSPGGHPSVRI